MLQTEQIQHMKTAKVDKVTGLVGGGLWRADQPHPQAPAPREEAQRPVQRGKGCGSENENNNGSSEGTS